MSACPATPISETLRGPVETTVPVTWDDPGRFTSFATWIDGLRAEHGLDLESLRLASADASFRRYFRIDGMGGSRIIMDAPPDQENCHPFVRIAGLMSEAGLNVPEVLAWDQAAGFLLLSDLGGHTMMQALQPENPQAGLRYYLLAIDALLAWQLASKPGVLPPHNQSLMLSEMELFPQWYLAAGKSVVMDDTMRGTLDHAFHLIARECLAWPSVFVHSDFMPRNLMLPVAGVREGPAEQRMGVLDFQDALVGPITYDIASLMRDAFLTWEEDFVLDITIRYWEKARAAGLPVGQDFGSFYRAVEWMGLQRHLRVAGIFARLTLRDGKPRYLADTPRFIRYIRSTAGRYRELKPLLRLVDKVEGIQDAGAYGFGRV